MKTKRTQSTLQQAEICLRNLYSNIREAEDLVRRLDNEYRHSNIPPGATSVCWGLNRWGIEETLRRGIEACKGIQS